jgi:uncharacterized protein YecE (DUF72 family)
MNSHRETSQPAGTLRHGLRIGPAGWSYADWEGIVYPRPRARGFHEAQYLAQFFDTIEINTSFYQPLRPGLARLWTEKVQRNPHFKFTAKLWRRFTHERDAGPAEQRAFKEGLAPLVEAGRLGALLMQFPWSFKYTRENREYLGVLAVEFMEYPLVLEVRHRSWDQPEVYEMLSRLKVGFCNIDQPLIGRSLGPTERSTAPVGYIRLHGRNYEHWFTAEDHPEERYNYLYSLSELEPWAERAQRVAEHSQSTYVIANNHFEGKAVANALELTSLLSEAPVAVPESLKAHYPELRRVAAPGSAPGEPEQGSLAFDDESDPGSRPYDKSDPPSARPTPARDRARLRRAV